VTGSAFLDLAVLPLAFGLLGFIEPCSIGATLIFIKVMEGKPAAAKLGQVVSFTVSRAIFIGALGALAALVGGAFLGFQRAAWVLLGALYVALGSLYVFGKTGWIMRSIGPGLRWISTRRGSAALGMLFGLNIPACAAPLLLALLGSSAAGAISGGSALHGFVTLGLFGLGLSVPLVIAVLFKRAHSTLERLASLSRTLPVWTGLLLVALGGWSIWFGAFFRATA
jgi:cytochrome c-type biogenesis protein